ncbi:hypothetical protein ACH5RR_009271 [Cinchona calisaya]|uniref:SKP1-like protein n=1 Tax=Cinchona calisaya TaxID=153742 RepID=A0ABD3ADX4_9GENT
MYMDLNIVKQTIDDVALAFTIKESEQLDKLEIEHSAWLNIVFLEFEQLTEDLQVKEAKLASNQERSSVKSRFLWPIEDFATSFPDLEPLPPFHVRRASFSRLTNCHGECFHLAKRAKIPKGMLKEIERCNRKFLLGETDDRRRIHTVSRKVVCQPKENRGLGIHNPSIKQPWVISFGFFFDFDQSVEEKLIFCKTTMSSSKMIVLKSSDGETFELEEAVARESQTIKHMIEDNCANTCIPLPNVTSNILAKVIEYLNKHVATKPSSSDSEESLNTFDTDFVKVDHGTLLDLIMAANYLDIKSLLNLTCQTVADMIKDKKPEEIRAFFNIVNDYTPEEEEEVRRENAWAFE